MVKCSALSSVRALAFAVATAALLPVAALGGSMPTGLSVRTLSSRPDMVTGGDVVVELNASVAIDWSAELNGIDVTSDFRPVEGERRFIAVLTGLREGSNSLDVRVAGELKSELRIINHPPGAGVFAGPRHGPEFCETEVNGLGPPTDAECSAPTRIDYYYKVSGAEKQGTSAKGSLDSGERFAKRMPPAMSAGFRLYDASQPAQDVAQTRISGGRTIPYIVRRETGVIDHVAYDLRFLQEPGKPLPTPWGRSGTAWNGRLVYASYSSGCFNSYGEDVIYSAEADEVLIAEGYAVVTSAQNVFSGNCNPVVAAETVAMIKEHFAKQYGAPVHTIGWGPSNGAMRQYFTAQNYPGLFDGIIPFISYPDALTFVFSTSDCRLLTGAFERSHQAWTDKEKASVSGFASWATCQKEAKLAPVDPRDCIDPVPRTDIYDPISRRDGVRCDYFANTINMLGRDARTGLGARLLDNVGVQYGLNAFNTRVVDAEHFVELNELVGGFDDDGDFVQERTHAGEDAARRAYETGLVLTGAGGLTSTPIIDWRWYTDDVDNFHVSFESFATRARLIKASGHADNQVVLTYAGDSRYTYTDSDINASLIALREHELVPAMDHWLDNIAADNRPGTAAERVTRNKPASLKDACWTKGGQEIAGTDIYRTNGKCRRLYPLYADPRIVAGAPLANDILKCRLKPLSTSDYKRPLSKQQLQRLRAVFPNGVCDYRRPGFGQEIAKSIWRTY